MKTLLVPLSLWLGLLLHRQAGRQSIPVCNQLFSCLNGTRDYNFNPDMSHLQELITADKVIPQSVPQGRCKNKARVNAVCLFCFFFTSMRFNKRNPGASAAGFTELRHCTTPSSTCTLAIKSTI